MSIYRYFFKKLEKNIAEILRKFLRHFEIIASQNLVKIFSIILERFQGFLEKLKSNFELILQKFLKICEKT